MSEKYVTLTIVPTSCLLANDKIQKLERLRVGCYITYDRRGRGLLIRIPEKDLNRARKCYGNSIEIKLEERS